MIYHADEMILSPIREVFRGPVNDVLVCQDLRSPVRSCYILLAIRDRETAKRLLLVLQNSQRETGGKKPYVKMFTENELLCLLFEYRPERRLDRFAPGQLVTPQARERVCINLVMECLSSPLPYPLLFLALEKENLHLLQDDGVYFTCCFDLSRLDESAGEAQCADRCVQILLSLLRKQSRRQLKSFELLRKKSDRGAYASLPELYRDIRISALPEKKASLKERSQGFWERNKDTFFRILLRLSIAVAVIALIILISQLIFGGFPLLRLFQNTFEVIGTENLTCA